MDAKTRKEKAKFYLMLLEDIKGLKDTQRRTENTLRTKENDLKAVTIELVKSIEDTPKHVTVSLNGDITLLHITGIGIEIIKPE